jgi:hypothetical protein
MQAILLPVGEVSEQALRKVSLFLALANCASQLSCYALELLFVQAVLFCFLLCFSRFHSPVYSIHTGSMKTCLLIQAAYLANLVR